MKVGLSFSRCMRDIIEGRVDYEDVLVIIARTDFNPHDDAHWTQIWNGYRYGGGWSETEWASAEPGMDDTKVEEMYRHVTKQLYDNGKIHQPRQYTNGHPARMPYYWLECSVPEDEMNPTVKAAWEQYQVVAGLSR